MMFSTQLSSSQKSLLSKAEDTAEEALHKVKHILPHIARLCFVVTFLEDIARVWCYWDLFLEFWLFTYSLSWSGAQFMVTLHFFSELVPIVLLLLRKQLYGAITVLTIILLLSGYFTGELLDRTFYSRTIPVLGGFMFIIASELKPNRRSLMAGLPSASEETQTRTYFQLFGRIFLVIMFTINLWRSEYTLFFALETFVGYILIIMVLVGYKTRLATGIQSFWMFFMNFYHFAYWNIPKEDIFHRSNMQFHFYQTLSIIGGLLFCVSMGAGEISVDAHKKKL